MAASPFILQKVVLADEDTGVGSLIQSHRSVNAAGVAATNVVASIMTSGIGVSWLGLPAQFGLVFWIVAFASLFGSLPCALLKWEDK